MNNLPDLSILNPRELEALEKWQEASLPPIAVSRALQMYELFCTGNSCEQIQKLNPQFDLGAIVHARLRDKWDKHHDEYVADLYSKIRPKVFQATMETIAFTADVLTAAHKLHGEKIKKFIQSGDEKNLEGVIRIDSLKQYKDAAEMLLKLTGQDKAKADDPLKGAPGANAPQAQVAAAAEVQVLPANTGMNANQAGLLIRRQLEKAKENR